MEFEVVTVPADQDVSGRRDEYLADPTAYRSDLSSYLESVPFAD